MTQTNYKGYDLFIDIEDKVLQTRNRAVVLTNLAEDNKDKNSRIKGKGTALILGYFNALAEGDRKQVYEEFKEQMKLRGFQLIGA